MTFLGVVAGPRVVPKWKHDGWRIGIFKGIVTHGAETVERLCQEVSWRGRLFLKQRQVTVN